MPTVCCQSHGHRHVPGNRGRWFLTVTGWSGTHSLAPNLTVKKQNKTKHRVRFVCLTHTGDSARLSRVLAPAGSRCRKPGRKEQQGAPSLRSRWKHKFVISGVRGMAGAPADQMRATGGGRGRHAWCISRDSEYTSFKAVVATLCVRGRGEGTTELPCLRWPLTQVSWPLAGAQRDLLERRKKLKRPLMFLL